MDGVKRLDGFVEGEGGCLRNLLEGARVGGQIGVAFTVFKHVSAFAANLGGYDWETEWFLKKDFAVILVSTLAGGVAGAFKDDSRLFGFLASAITTGIVTEAGFRFLEPPVL